MVLPKRLEINIPPSISSIAEAAVGRDAVMRSLARAVFEADVLEQALQALSYTQTPAGGISLPDAFVVGDGDGGGFARGGGGGCVSGCVGGCVGGCVVGSN